MPALGHKRKFCDCPSDVRFASKSAMAMSVKGDKQTSGRDVNENIFPAIEPLVGSEFREHTRALQRSHRVPIRKALGRKSA